MRPLFRRPVPLGPRWASRRHSGRSAVRRGRRARAFNAGAEAARRPADDAPPGPRAPAAIPLWPLPLLAALLPAVATVIALTLYSRNAGTFCNPFIEDCVSISRMARHGLANHLFRMLVIPGAVLQVLTWLAGVRAQRAFGLPKRQARLLAALGVGGAAMLVVYATFLGTDGAAYRWLRHWGTGLYFGGTYFAMLVFVRGVQQLHDANRLALPRLHRGLFLVLLGVVTTMCTFHAFALAAPAWLVDRIENLTEWWSAAAMTGVFFTMAALWRRWGVTVAIAVRGPRASPDRAPGPD